MSDPIDQLVVTAVKRAAKDPFYGGPQGPEANLVAALRAALEEAPGVRSTSTEVRYEFEGWTRLRGVPGGASPGGVDLAADLEVGGRILIEAKKDKPEESLWDAIKLADTVESGPEPPISAAYLMYDGMETVWRPTTDVSELFLRPVQDWRVRGLIATWPRAWLKLLGGGKGIRPRETVMGIDFHVPLDVKLEAYPDRVLRILRVRPNPAEIPQHFDADGWPDGYEPPENFREIGQEWDQALLKTVSEPAKPAPEVGVDACHGYPWYSVWTTSRIAAVLTTLDEGAAACLRRLNEERDWTETELQERFDPHLKQRRA